MDSFLKSRLIEYKNWIETGKIRYSAKIIPVNESLEEKQWILPSDQVLEILRKARTIALSDCICRSHYKRCSNPLNVCLLLNQYGETFIEKGVSKKISYEKANTVIETANENGLVHLSLYRPDHELYALCSCCPCCCHDLQLLLNYKQESLIAHSDYIAVTDMEKCIHCGECIPRCYFHARKFDNNEMLYDSEKCYGCGLCTTVCPANATVMNPKKDSQVQKTLSVDS